MRIHCLHRRSCSRIPLLACVFPTGSELWLEGSSVLYGEHLRLNIAVCLLVDALLFLCASDVLFSIWYSNRTNFEKLGCDNQKAAADNHSWINPCTYTFQAT